MSTGETISFRSSYVRWRARRRVGGVPRFLLCKHAVPHLSAGASIIITSSVVGLTAAPMIAGYSTAKHAQVGLMRTLAAELAPRGIRVNTIHPGPVDNEFQHRIEVVATGADVTAATKILSAGAVSGLHAWSAALRHCRGVRVVAIN